MGGLGRALGDAVGRLIALVVQRARIERYLDRRPPVGTPAPPQGERARVGVVQLEARLHHSALSYAEQMLSAVATAVGNGAQLVVFPEDVGSYPLLGLLPGLPWLVGRGRPGTAGAAVAQGKAPVLALMRLMAPAVRKAHRVVFSGLAKRFGVYILAGSTLATDEAGRVYKEAHLYDADGRLILAQRKTHLFPAEATWGLTPGDEVAVVQTPLGCIASPICMDHTYWEPIRIAWLQGAEIIIDPAADANHFNWGMQARGVWSRVQESPAYGVHAMLVGELLGVTFGGRSGVYAPLELTPHKDGIVAEASVSDAPDVFCADVDLAELRELRHQREGRLRPELYARYLPRLYGEMGEAIIAKRE
jgi:predicted amidohydrolase